ncbi:MAG: tetratricopeptide repeat protein [Duganella sp.]
MSLLMQALKKAERAKQSAAADTEVDKPSQEFDEILALTPAAPAPAATPIEPQRDTGLGLDFAATPAFSLEPLPPLTPTPGPAPELAPLTPPLAASPPPAAEPVPPAPAPVADAENVERPEKQAVQADKADTTADARPRSTARARAAAPAPASAAAVIDPERLRLIVLLSILALIVLGFGYYYWQAVMAPGAGSRLPPVAMPPPGATGATPLQVIAPAGAPSNSPAPGEVFGQADDDGSANGMLAPSSSAGLNRAAREDIERRLARTEQELAAAQQAIQAQLNAPRQERLPPVAAPDNAEIRVARAVKPAQVTPGLDAAYRALGSGDLANAQLQYEAALRQDPNSRDALLGMAAVAARQQQGAQASAWYLRLLELDPNDATAVAGLVSVRGGDIGQNERRLKAILTTSPEAGPALFALGNLYAQQSRWPEAQQTYFRAYSAAPDNPDYAYNLAIGLDRLNQGKLALTYYQRALTLAQDRPAAFSANALRQRMQELGAAGTAH